MRTRKKRKQVSDVSASHYVGYVEDDESVDAIMKKFEELEKLQKELHATTSTPEPISQDEPSLPPCPDQFPEDERSLNVELIEKKQQGFTEEQLEELFKRTSSFTIKSAVLNEDDEIDEMDLLRLEYGDDEFVFLEEDDYNAIDDDDDFWDEEFGTGRKRGTNRSGTRRTNDREAAMQRYKVLQLKMQDRQGNYYTFKKKISLVDPWLPTYVRIPPCPIPRSWVHAIRPLCIFKPTECPGSRYIEENILKYPLHTLGKEFLAIYMDPPLLLPNEDPKVGKISISQFASLAIPKVIPKGFLFIWVEKENILEVLKVCEKWDFKYVENFCWIKKRPNNLIAKQPYDFFLKSKLTMLILRKEGEVELRHQRNPDCVFDFIRPLKQDEITETKPLFSYKVIETLLPQAVYSEQNKEGGRMLELWAKKGTRRKGWTTLVDIMGFKENEQ